MKSAAEFFAEHGRPPMIEHGEKPWEYCGWLRWYVQMQHQFNPKVLDRWGYWAEAMDTGKLPDGPIPVMQFGTRSKEADKNLETCLNRIAGKTGSWTTLRELVGFMSYGMATMNEDRLTWPEDLKEFVYRTLNVGLMLENPYDYLGQMLSERYGGGPTAFFPTPHQVVECMTEMVMHDVKLEDGRDPRTASVIDPCVGSGRMLLHASRYSVNLWGMDIDPMMVEVTKINGAMYAPWIAWPFPPEITGSRMPPPDQAVVTPQMGEVHVTMKVQQVVETLAKVGIDPVDLGMEITGEKPKLHRADSRDGQLSLFAGLQTLQGKKRKQ